MDSIANVMVACVAAVIVVFFLSMAWNVVHILAMAMAACGTFYYVFNILENKRPFLSVLK